MIIIKSDSGLGEKKKHEREATATAIMENDFLCFKEIIRFD